MKRWLRPTLARRMMGALLLAFALVWLVLMARQLYLATDRQAFDQNLQTLGENLLASIAPIEAPGEARAIVAATAALINQSYRSNHVPGVLLMELRAADGKRLFWSPEGGNAVVRGTPGRIDPGEVHGQPYRVYQGRGERWTLLVAAPRMPAGWLVRNLSGGLTIDMLIALPFVILPLWFAVTRGLRPLRSLSGQIATRSAGDLAPLGAPPRHAELQPLAQALDGLLARLRHEVSREQAFVQDAAHELRTPMAVMSAQAHVLLMSTDADQRSDAERRMRQAIARASHLVGQLLDLAQLDQQRPADAGVCDVAQLLRHELALIAPAALARQIELSLDAPDALHHALDLPAFQSIVHNLLNNALAYVPDNGQVRVSLQGAQPGLVLVVADDGPGIAPDQRALVFERFHRGGGNGTSPAAPGAGLGLAIVREAAARLDGHVTLEGGIGGRGCRFAVMLYGAPQASVLEPERVHHNPHDARRLAPAGVVGV
ncbi:sensor histidine kinase [Massilia sp. S19_KUP03_FR1]|uniref:sensor histidine kinase n=1 Tax=Massilia sp. S19_KUP03_FR1 TaxID=3025503 RepID=UPI002FCD8A97